MMKLNNDRLIRAGDCNLKKSESGTRFNFKTQIPHWFRRVHGASDARDYFVGEFTAIASKIHDHGSRIQDTGNECVIAASSYPWEAQLRSPSSKAHDFRDGFRDELKIEPQGPLVDILAIELHDLFEVVNRLVAS